MNGLMCERMRVLTYVRYIQHYLHWRCHHRYHHMHMHYHWNQQQRYHKIVFIVICMHTHY